MTNWWLVALAIVVAGFTFWFFLEDDFVSSAIALGFAIVTFMGGLILIEETQRKKKRR